MASSSVTLSPHSLSSFPHPPSQSTNPHRNLIILRFQLNRTHLPIQASRRNSNFPHEGNNLADDPRNWSRNHGVVVEDYNDDDEDEDDEEEEDRSLDLLVRFVENVFKKVSRKARRAVRSVLPPSISSKLVGFSVNGVIILAFLWVLKAFLEATLFTFLFDYHPTALVSVKSFAAAICCSHPPQVICTLGSVVFVSILLIRGVWAGVSYLQESRNHNVSGFDDEQHRWSDAQPAT